MKIVVVAQPGFARSTVNVNLRSSGYEVVEAEPTSLFDVLRLLRLQLPHLVILEYELPRVNCETLVRIIREDTVLAVSPVLVVFTSEAPAAEARMGRWEQVGFLHKPLQVESLLQAVHEQVPDFRIVSLGHESAS
jgi:DNA-binding response OmpR family regulator